MSVPFHQIEYIPDILERIGNIKYANVRSVLAYAAVHMDWEQQLCPGMNQRHCHIVQFRIPSLEFPALSYVLFLQCGPLCS